MKRNSILYRDLKNKFSLCLKDKNGVAALEFAIIMTVVSAVFIGIADYGLAMFEKMELTSAARAGAQIALIDTSDTAAIEAAVVAATNSSITTDDVTTSTTCECATTPHPDACGDTCEDGSANRYYFTVTATEDYSLMITGTTISLTGSATIRTR